MVSISRVFYPLSGTSLWQEAYLTRDEIKNLDKNFVDSSEEAVKITILCFIAVGVFLDFLIWKKRKLAMSLMYYELVYMLLHGLVPYDYGKV